MIEIFGWIFFVVIPAASLFFLICSSCYREVSRYFSMILYFCMWLYIIFEIPAEACGLWYNSDLEKFRIAVYCMVPGIWLILFIEHYFCTEYEYLTNLGDVSDSANIVRNLRFSQPRITFHIQCYHYETRYRTITETKRDAHGRSRTETRTESYQQRVNTHRANEMYHYDRCEDISSDGLDGINCQGVTRIRLTKDVQCGDSITKEDYYAKYADFKMRNNRDAHMDSSIDTKIPGFVERIAVTSDENGKVPEWMTTKRFTWFTVLLMTWPYRWMFNHKTGKTTYEIKKSIFVNPSFQNPFPNTNPGGFYPPSSAPSYPPNYPGSNAPAPPPPNYPDNASNYPPKYYGDNTDAQNYPPNYPDNASNYPPNYPNNATSNYPPQYSDENAKNYPPNYPGNNQPYFPPPNQGTNFAPNAPAYPDPNYEPSAPPSKENMQLVDDPNGRK